MSDVYQEFIDLLERQLACTNELLNLLNEERSALTSPNPNLISDVIPRKLRCIQQLDELDKRRESICPLNQAADPKAIFAKVIDSFPAHLQLPVRQLWSQLKTKVLEAKESSQNNGRLIALRQRSVEKGLRILKGQTAQTNLYDTRGRMQGLNLKHHSIKA